MNIRNVKKTAIFVLLSVMSFSLQALDLSVGKDDVFIVQSPEGGYHLYIRAKKDIKSVLLTETTRDPTLRSDNYAYRAPLWNAINGDEKRLLDGEFIPKEKGIYSLIDSSIEKNTPIGDAFHIWIPYLISYGYSWTRNAEVQVLDGTYLNIRTFSKPWADYTGTFKDNPFKIRLTQKPVVKANPPAEITYMADTVATFSNLAEKTVGGIKYASGAKDVVPLIRELLESPTERSLDLVLVLDATESMVDDIDEIRESLKPMLEELLPTYPSWRIALVLYKDYFEDFLVKQACPFTTDLTVFKKALGSFRVQGGRDIPEAVYEGLDGALALDWNPEADKKIILIGDAPPHPKPRGRVTKEMVEAKAAEKNVQLNVIILPHGETH
ncbi:MAG TPA: vWA domain-containing protein [Treponemataceae bacterium]|nr:vWA domain-containing protein [Treponemataceae bacterium]